MATNGWSKEKQDDKVCFKGSIEKGNLIIKELERLGGVNLRGLSGFKGKLDKINQEIPE